MHHHRKQQSREQHKTRARRKDDQTLTNVVSLRISDKEKKLLEKVTRSTSRNVSDVIREAMNLWLERRQKLGLDAAG